MREAERKEYRAKGKRKREIWKGRRMAASLDAMKEKETSIERFVIITVTVQIRAMTSN